jgi:hypothetical protein
VAVWIPIARAVRRYGPLVGPFVFERFRRDAQPYWQAYQQARRIDGHLGVWMDDEGKHWVVLTTSRSEVAGSFPPMSPQQRRLAVDNLDHDQLQHHTETVWSKLEHAPAKLKGVIPTRQGRSDS